MGVAGALCACHASLQPVHPGQRQHPLGVEVLRTAWRLARRFLLCNLASGRMGVSMAGLCRTRGAAAAIHGASLKPLRTAKQMDRSHVATCH